MKLIHKDQCLFLLMSLIFFASLGQVDDDLNIKTKALYENLKVIQSGSNVLFGQEFFNSFQYSSGGAHGNKEFSDCKSVTGAHPAVLGSDFHYYLEKNDTERGYHREAAKWAFQQGYVITFDWHISARGTTSYSCTGAPANLAKNIANGNANGDRDWFLGELDKVIEIINEELVVDGDTVPIVFRPFHEMNGNWFWWGACSGLSASEYKLLYQLLVDYMKARTCSVLFCWSPNSSFNSTYYPGDDYVDFVGVDAYETTISTLRSELGKVVDFSVAHDKIAVFSETGDRNADANSGLYWKDVVLPGIVSDPTGKSKQIAWVLTWINSSWSKAYVPHSGSNSTVKQSFIEFKNSGNIIFGDEIPQVYVPNTKISVGKNGGSTQNQNKSVQQNQVGFYPEAKKLAVVTDIDATEFYLTRVGDDAELFRTKLGEIRTSAYSPKKTRIADFSSFREPGEYILKLPNSAASFPFKIDEYVHQQVLKGAIKSYYYQRFGVELIEEFAGKWKRASSVNPEKILVHASAASSARPEGTVVSSPGGWIDAGDYNKYVVNSGITTATLLFAFEDYFQYLDTLNLSIPESKNEIPDILDEIVWNLRWMLSMQDPNDGGVYHKCTNAKFDPMVMPHEAVQPRYVVQKSTAAALNLAAVAAVSARVLKKFPKGFSGLADSCRMASVAAWEWARRNPNVEYDQRKLNQDFDPDILTGAYSDKNFSDEFFWAACELAILFEDDRYLENVDPAKVKLAIPTWNQVALLGYYSLVKHNRNSIFLKPGKEQIQEQLIGLADEYVEYMESSTFSTVMGGNASDFVWGSNAVAANQGILMLKAYQITKQKKYLNAALSNLDYILGRNATGYSFVTGFGDKTPMHIHHRPSEADGIIEPVPGLLAGGPNPGMQDRCKYPSSVPNEAYVDDVCSYASNEVAINWNAPLVYLLTGIEFYSRD